MGRIEGSEYGNRKYIQITGVKRGKCRRIDSGRKMCSVKLVAQPGESISWALGAVPVCLTSGSWKEGGGLGITHYAYSIELNNKR